MFSLVGKLLISSAVGVTPVAIIITVATALSAPPRQEHKLIKEVSNSPLPAPNKVTVTKKEQEFEERKHDDCLDQNIKVVIQDSQGNQKTVPLTELNQHEGYKPIRADYVLGRCSRESIKR